MSNESLIEYYHKLFCFQDRVLEMIDALKTEFYLTGGTALSRFYLHHRYSDDLDFMMHKNPYFGDYIQQITDALQENQVEVKPYGISSSFAALHLFDLKDEEKLKLKVDFINEKSSPHFGGFNSTEKYSRIDNIRNILSNKISILSRQEPKDIADIWFICKQLEFEWDAIIAETGQKRLMEEIFVVECLRKFQPEKLSVIKWIKPVNIEDFNKDIEIIIEDIITKRENRLFQPQT